jgi:methylmalonyl-CoA mutase cobalamin-binding domain/chain
MERDELIKRLTNSVIEGEETIADETTVELLKRGESPMGLIKEAIQPALDYVGDRFGAGELFLPELILAGDAAKKALDHIIPLLEADNSDGAATQSTLVVMGTAYGDNHDIGKSVVKAILSANGFRVIDLGVNTPPKKFIETALKEGARIIGISTLITTSLPYQRETIKLMRDMGHREKFFVILGGGPVTPEWVAEIGADGYGREANDAAMVCKKLIEGGRKPPLDAPLIEGALKKVKR